MLQRASVRKSVVKTCSVTGCERIRERKGRCKRHADQVWRAENPEKVKAQKNRWNATHRASANASSKRWRLKNKRDKRPYRRSLKGLWNHAKLSANERGLAWEISLEQYEALRGLVCRYCQFPLPEAGSGLDRLDDAEGYVLGNVVPCCADCNVTRGNRYSHKEMLELGVVLRRLKLRRPRV
jgi:hypothetical protein